MEIKKKKFFWNGSLTKRNSTKYIILHHRAGEGDVDSIHEQHLSQGWSGIGYHYYIRKNGEIWQGRPDNVVGAHCQGQNSNSIGICFEGDFEKDSKVEYKQLVAGEELIVYLKKQYPKAELKRHCDFQNTACPGQYFPFETIKNGKDLPTQELTTVNDIVWELEHRKILSDKNLWLKKLQTDQNAYWLARKCVNYIRGIDG